jgi:hypothetical protein
MKITVIKPRSAASDERGEAILRSTFGVGKHRCTLTIDPAMAATRGAAGTLCAQWEPIPKRLNKHEMVQTV